MSKQKKVISIEDIKKDAKNFNKGTAEGLTLLNKSLEDFGALRSIVVDKSGNIIAGNKTFEQYRQLGNEDIEVVETEGEKLVVVKRNDLDLDTNAGRLAALADNHTSAVNLHWDYKLIKDTIRSEDIGDWSFDIPVIKSEFLEDTELEEIPKETPIKDSEDIEPEDIANEVSVLYQNDYFEEFKEDLKGIDKDTSKALVKVAEHIKKNYNLEDTEAMEEKLNKVIEFEAVMETKDDKNKVIAVCNKLGEFSTKTEKRRAIDNLGAGLLTAVRMYKEDNRPT